MNNDENGFNGPNQTFEKMFRQTKNQFDSEAQESLNRQTLKNSDFKKMLPLKNVIFVFTFLYGSNCAVNFYVK